MGCWRMEKNGWNEVWFEIGMEEEETLKEVYTGVLLREYGGKERGGERVDEGR